MFHSFTSTSYNVNQVYQCVLWRHLWHHLELQLMLLPPLFQHLPAQDHLCHMLLLQRKWCKKLSNAAIKHKVLKIQLHLKIISSMIITWFIRNTCTAFSCFEVMRIFLLPNQIQTPRTEKENDHAGNKSVTKSLSLPQNVSVYFWCQKWNVTRLIAED